MKRFLLFLFLITLVGCQSPPPTPPSNPHFTSYQLLDVNGRLEDFGKPYINTTPTDQNNLPLPEGFEYVIEEEAAISPDGQYLIYYMQRLDGPAELVIFNRDGSLYNIFDPSPGPSNSFFGLTVSKNNRIAFTNYHHDSEGVPTTVSIDIVDIDNTSVESYPIGPYPYATLTNKTWSPDATKIAYSDSGINILDLTTGKINRLNQGSNPLWLNDHSLAYFDRNQSQLMFMQYDLNTQQTSTLLTLPPDQRYSTGLSTISPDERLLAVQMEYTSSPPAVSSFCQKLQNLNPPAVLVSFTCGRVIQAAMVGEFNLLVIDLVGPKLEAVITLESQTDNLAFSPDSQWLSYLDDEGILLYHIPSGETQTYYQRLEGEWFSSLLWP